MSDLISNYIEARDALYNHCGFEENWTAYPLELGNIDSEWRLNANSIEWSDGNWTDSDTYSADLYRHRFFEGKAVYEGEDYTMVLGEPHVDLMIWLYVFKNTKRRDVI
jgi:hypothetical protein